ncbi:hypothetical protein [Methylobacter psychrophilus]|uniref:hypothetical protein n=1 Tax=Methylobacter psychrophilus TaxID=96941 RepID=UPI0021D4EAC5|nr:hypothetical protein [Methylobacter psychrophilus]
MKKLILDKIQEIKTDKLLTTRQKWVEILAIETHGKRGALEARKIQDEIKSKWESIKNRVHRKSTPAWKSPFIRLERYNANLEIKKRNDELLANDIKNGYPSTLLTGNINGLLTLVNIGDLVGGNTKQYAVMNDFIVSSCQSEVKDFDYYSKSYKYPKVTISDREVLIRRMSNGIAENYDVQVDSWRGAWALKAFNTVPLIIAMNENNKLKDFLKTLETQHDDVCHEEECFAL